MPPMMIAASHQRLLVAEVLAWRGVAHAGLA
jgi:hypothetical protein